MNIKVLKQIGWILILCGLVGVGITAAEMMAIGSGETIDSPPVLAEAISGTLLPATIGSVSALAGLIMLLLGWWRGRPRNQPDFEGAPPVAGGRPLTFGKRKVSTKSKVILTCLPFLVIGVIALFLPKIRDWQAAQTLERLETMPLKSIVSESENDITSTRRTYSIGSYGVTDVGNLRLAFEELSFSGSSSGGVTLATDSTSKGGGGHTGVGKRRFEEKSIPGGMQCRFGGVTFEFVDGKLNFGDEIIDATGSPTLVLVGASREILGVKPLRTPED